MLSYDICRKLKETGYPQNTDRHWYAPEGKEPAFRDVSCDRSFVTIARYFQGEAREKGIAGIVACPNSDEIIAAIQARWPDVDIELEYRHLRGTLCPDHLWSVWAGDGLGETHRVENATGNTPADALAALYLALAEVTP